MYALKLKHLKPLLCRVLMGGEEEFAFDHVSIAMQHFYILEFGQVLFWISTTIVIPGLRRFEVRGQGILLIKVGQRTRDRSVPPTLTLSLSS